MYTLNFGISLGMGKPNSTLFGRILNTTGSPVGSEIPSGSFVNLGGGNYSLAAPIPDAHRGVISFYESGSSASPLAIASINPETAENLDAKVSAVSGGGGPIGSGSVQTTITVTDEAGNPLDGVAVWVSTDSGGNNVVAGTLHTNALGQVVFMLDEGVYYVWRQLAGFNFINPVQITVVST
jgi:hypothetical protein